MKKNTVSVCIATHKRPKDLERCLLSIYKGTKLPDELLVMEDHSEDLLTSRLISRMNKKAKPKIKFYRSFEKKGQQRIRNNLIKYSTCDIIAFVDDDSEVAREWLEYLSQAYDDERIDICGGPALICDDDLRIKNKIIRSKKNLNRINRYGQIYDFISCWIPPKSVLTELIMGANMSFRREILDGIYFDPGYTNGQFEDFDVVYRLKKKGHKILYHPKVLVFHKVSQSGRMNMYHLNYYKGYNLIYFIKKNIGGWLPYAAIFFGMNNTNPPPIPRLLLGAIVRKDPSRIRIIEGYLRGMIEIRHRNK